MDIRKQEIPADIVHDIFIRLRAKSLMRFRSISKNWCNTIDSFPFANKHISTRVAADEEPELLPLSYFPGVATGNEHSFIYDGNVIKESDIPILEFSKDGNYVHNVAYGLLCFQNRNFLGRELFLCNPVRGEFLKLPQPLPATLGNELYYEVMAWYGIGFDSTTNSYKIIQVRSFPTCINGFPDWFLDRNFESQVYTLGTHSWRLISSSVSLSSQVRGVSANGDMHWLNWNNKIEQASITSFDFKKEEFMETPLPNFGYKQHYKKNLLINLKGFLAIVSFPSDQYIDIWVLKDYENKEWAREYRISTQVWAREQDNTCVIRSDLCFWENKNFSVGVCSNGLFLEAYSYSRIFVVDLITNRIWYMECPKSYRSFGRTLFSYTGSVLSLRNFGN
ncbi:F-box protein [Melia azedarach]|uniref:F-box protein n=1 Tax=Melia azedarach TaxID=155640 RepID=A0ACC1X426_MELAZ|nr:F-box protein [Melia azedarach]